MKLIKTYNLKETYENNNHISKINDNNIKNERKGLLVYIYIYFAYKIK